MPHVLVVDDDDFALRLCRQQLALAGFPDVTVAGGAREALDLLAADPEAFDVLLCDLQMPPSTASSSCGCWRKRTSAASWH